MNRPTLRANQLLPCCSSRLEPNTYEIIKPATQHTNVNGNISYLSRNCHDAKQLSLYTKAITSNGPIYAPTLMTSSLSSATILCPVKAGITSFRSLRMIRARSLACVMPGTKTSKNLTSRELLLAAGSLITCDQTTACQQQQQQQQQMMMMIFRSARIAFRVKSDRPGPAQ